MHKSVCFEQTATEGLFKGGWNEAAFDLFLSEPIADTNYTKVRSVYKSAEIVCLIYTHDIL